MEKRYEIPTDDDHIIYGVLNSKETKSDKLIIFVHGLASNKTQHTFYNSATFFPNNGYDTFRFDLYSKHPKGRKLKSSTLQEYANDTTKVIEKLSEEYDQIYIIGHSLGGPTVINSNLDKIKSIVLWDPALTHEGPAERKSSFEEFSDHFIYEGAGVSFYLSKEFMESLELGNESMIQKISKPIKLIFAERFFLKEVWAKHLDKIPTEHESIIIKGANHGFDEEGTEEELFKETLNWLNSH